MVFLVLALTWVAVLTFWYRSRSQQALTDSVTEFHHHLRVLERAAPGTRTAANRLRGPAGAPLSPAAAVAAVAAVTVTGAPVGIPAEFPSRPVRAAPGEPSPVAAGVISRRQRLQRRRRDVLVVLTVVAVATFAMTLLDRVPDAAMAQMASDVALVAYLALLIRSNRAGTRQSSGRRPAGSRRRQRGVEADRTGSGTHLDGEWEWGAQWDPAVGSQPVEAWNAAGGGQPAGRWNAAAQWEPVGSYADDGEDDTASLDAASLRRAVGH